MKKLFLFAVIVLCGCATQGFNAESSTGLGTSPFSTGGSFTKDDANAMNDSINDNDSRLDTIEAISGIVECDGAGTCTSATGGTDYLRPADMDSEAEIEAIVGIDILKDADLGTGADDVVQLNGSAQLPAVDGSLLLGLSGSFDRLTEGITIQTFASNDTTPDVTNGGTSVHRVWRVHGSTSPIITDFDDGDDHSEFSDNDWFYLIVDYTASFDFSDNANMEGNGGIDFDGLASQVRWLHFIYEDGTWNETTLAGQINPTTLAISKLATRNIIVYDADGIDLVDADCGKYIVMTGAGDVGMPDCDGDLDGCKITIRVENDSQTNRAIMYADTTNDFFRLKDGTNLDANDAADLPDGASDGGKNYEFMCVGANVNHRWDVWEEEGAVTDGTAAGCSQGAATWTEDFEAIAEGEEWEDDGDWTEDTADDVYEGDTGVAQNGEGGTNSGLADVSNAGGNYVDIYRGFTALGSSGYATFKFWYRVTGTERTGVISIRDGGAYLTVMRWDGTNLEIQDNLTWTDIVAASANTWYLIEVEIDLADSDGINAVKVWVGDGSTQTEYGPYDCYNQSNPGSGIDGFWVDTDTQDTDRDFYLDDIALYEAPRCAP